MGPVPFDLTLSSPAPVLLALVPALLNLGILAYLLGRAKRNALSLSFALFVAALVAWQSAEALMRMSRTPATASFWSAALAMGALLIGPFGVHFALLFTERRRMARSPLLWIVLYGPALAIESLSRAGVGRETLGFRPPWGWMPELPIPALGAFTGFWVAGLAFATLALLLGYAARLPRGDARRRQAMLVAVGFSVPTLQGTLTQVLFPLLGLEPIPVASTFMTAFSLCTLVALRRHRFLDLPTVEDRLREAQVEAQQRAVLLAEAQRIAHVGNWLWDLATNRVQWSDEMYRIYGYPAQSFTVTFDKAMERVAPEDRDRIRASVADDVRRAEAGALPPTAYTIELPDGSRRLLQGRGRLEVDNGKPVRIMGTVQDVTEIRAAEQADRLAFERLLEIEKLRSVDEFKTRFLNTASHELNTPITPIRLQLHLLKAGKFGGLSDRQAHSVDIVDRGMQRLAALVQDLLDVARLEGGALRLQLSPVDVRQVAREVVETYRAAAAERGITLQEDGAGPPCVVQADARRVGQVFFNLLSNAMKFTPSGGRVEVRVEPNARGVHAVVRDTGSGLDAQQRSLLFRPFSQVHREAAMREAGTGLGLYICRGILEAHGGRIWVESDGPARGSAFTFELPFAPPAAEGGPVPGAAQPPRTEADVTA